MRQREEVQEVLRGHRARSDDVHRAERASAYAKLERFIEEQLGPEDDAALDEFWGEYMDQDVDLDELDDALSNDTYDVWFSFDRPLDDGTLAVDRFLETGTR